jgi:hypothetical protein
MQTIALAQVPNQSFSTTLDGVLYNFRIFQANGVMCYDISAASTGLNITGQRLTNGTFLVPFFCYSAASGNFLLLNTTEDLPTYEQFGLSLTLIYLSEAEIQVAVALAPRIGPTFVAYAVA